MHSTDSAGTRELVKALPASLHFCHTVDIYVSAPYLPSHLLHVSRRDVFSDPVEQLFRNVESVDFWPVA